MCPHLLLNLCTSIFNLSISSCCRFFVDVSLAYPLSSSLAFSSSMAEISLRSSPNFICFCLSLLISCKRPVFSLVIYSSLLLRFSFSLMAVVNAVVFGVKRSGKGLHTFVSWSFVSSAVVSSGVCIDLILSSFHCFSSSFEKQKFVAKTSTLSFIFEPWEPLTKRIERERLCLKFASPGKKSCETFQSGLQRLKEDV